MEGVGAGTPLLGDGAGEGTAAFRGAGAGTMLLGDGAGDGVGVFAGAGAVALLLVDGAGDGAVLFDGLGVGTLFLVDGAGDGAGDFITGGGGVGVDGHPAIHGYFRAVLENERLIGEHEESEIRSLPP